MAVLLLGPPHGVRAIGGTVVTWGDNSYGQTNGPVVANAVAVAAGSYFCLALRDDGTVTAWGANWSGQANVPPGLDGVVAIDAGWSHAMALRGNGTVAVWGDNMYGVTNVPPGLTNVTAIASGSWHCLALREGGTVIAWGTGRTNVPSGLCNVVAIAAGAGHNLALRSDGTVTGWGQNDHGQASIPSGLSNVVAVAAGGYHSLALRSDGTVLAWGYNQNGATNVPSELESVIGLAGGFLQSAALTAPGEVVMWGGTLGTGAPKPQAGLSNVIAFSLGGVHAMALVGDGAPVITVPPFSRRIVTGHGVTFRVVAGGEPPLSYQWRWNGQDLMGATAAVLRLPEVRVEDGGGYTVVVANGLGRRESAVAVLEAVVQAPVVIVEPASRQIDVGRDVTFRSSAEGSLPMSHQWRRNGLDLPGATNTSLTLPAVQLSEAGRYTVVVRNEGGATESEPAQLTVIGRPPAVSVQPSGQEVTFAGTTTIEIAVEGAVPMGFQWWHEGVAVVGGTGPALVISQASFHDGGSYTLVVTNAFGAITSAPVRLFLSFGDAFSGPDDLLLWDFSGSYPAPLLQVQQQSDGTLTSTSGGSGQVWESAQQVWVSLTTAWPDDYWIEHSATHLEYVLSDTCTAKLSLGPPSGGQRVLSGQNECVRVSQEFVLFLWTWAPYRDLTITRSVHTVAVPVPANVTGAWRVVFDAVWDGDRVVGRAYLTLSTGRVMEFEVTGARSTVTRTVLNLVSSANWLTLVTTGPEMFVESVEGSVAGQTIHYEAPLRVCPLTVTIRGDGRVNAPGRGRPLTVGRDYTLQAVPRPGMLFSNWVVAGQSVTDPRLQFTMSSNLAITANFVPNPFVELKGRYFGLYADTNDSPPASAGFVSLTIAESGAFSGQLREGTAAFPFSGTFALDLSAKDIIARHESQSLTVDLHLASGSDQVTGEVRDERWTSPLSGGRAVFGAKRPATNYQGIYTVVLPGTADLRVGPAGHGFARVTVSSSGDVRVQGTLGDGASFSQAVPLNEGGRWPFYAGLYAGQGSILGWLTLEETATNDVHGRVRWTRPAGVPGSVHPGAFTNDIAILGSRYGPGTGPALGFSMGQILLEGGNLPTAVTNLVEWDDKNQLIIPPPNAQKLSLKVSVPSGTVAGGFVHPATGRLTELRGVLVPKQGVGAGRFSGADQSGRWLIFEALDETHSPR